MDTMDTIDPPAEKKSRWEDILDVFFAPADLFRRRANDRIGPPLITLLVLATLFYYLLLPAQKMILRAAMTAEMPEGSLPPSAEGIMNMMPIILGIMTPIMYLIMVAAAAAGLWLMCRAVGAKPAFRQMMIVATYAGFIGLLGQIAYSVAIMLHGEAGLDIFRHGSFGALRFTDTETTPKAVLAILRRFELFAIWQAVVWGIGVYVITGISKGKAAIVAGSVWLLAAVWGVVGGFLNPGGGEGTVQFDAASE